MVNTRAKNYDKEMGEPADTVAHDKPKEETLDERRARWSSLLRQQEYLAVITEVLEHELPRYRDDMNLNPSQVSRAMSECVLILASAPEVFRAAVDGTLTQEYLRDTNLQTEYLAIQGRANFQPSIYIHLLADANGVPPTPNQYLAIQEVVSKYIDDVTPDNALAFLIDNNSLPDFPPAANSLGLGKYLGTHRTSRSSNRVQTLRRFIIGIRDRVSSTPAHLLDTPLPFPPGECGYARNSHKRLAQHTKRQSSNYVMNLVEDICTHLYHTKVFKQQFYMHQYVIYLIFRPQQAEIAEIFVSGLLSVWVEGGGGFNHYPAGRSCRSAREVTREAWDECRRFAVEEAGMVEKLGLQMERFLEKKKGGKEDGEAVRVWAEALGYLDEYTSPDK